MYVGELIILLGMIFILFKLVEWFKFVCRFVVVLLVFYAFIGGVYIFGDIGGLGFEVICNFSIVYFIVFIFCGYYMVLDLGRVWWVLQIFGVVFLIQLVYMFFYFW